MITRLELERSFDGADLLALMKGHARITGTAQDTELTRYLNGAALLFEDTVHRLLVQATVKEYFDVWPWTYQRTVELSRAPVASVTSVKYYDADNVQQTWDSSNYDTDLVGEPARIRLSDTASLTLPSVYDKPNAVVIEYESGIAEVSGDDTAADVLPADVINALLVRATWQHGPGRELTPDISPEAVQRCWWNAVRRWQWKL